ncbi:MAG: hypothetical protein LC791_12505 [Acidobacteria bacterium]|nr:hypothetical protein [Acidobacteriota bacterium]
MRWTEVFEGIEAEAFRELALLAGEVSRAPITLVTLVDEERHWFTSVTGAHLTEGPWEGTFCAHAVLQTGVFVVPDAALDLRFARNPLVCAPLTSASMRAHRWWRMRACSALVRDGCAAA